MRSDYYVLELLLHGAFSTNRLFLTYFCEYGPAELTLNCSGDPPLETLILTELSNSAKKVLAERSQVQND